MGYPLPSTWDRRLRRRWRATRAANVEREIKPFIGFVPSLLLGALGTITAVALARAWPEGPKWTASQKEWRSMLLEGMHIWHEAFEKLGAGDEAASHSMEREEVCV